MQHLINELTRRDKSDLEILDFFNQNYSSLLDDEEFIIKAVAQSGTALKFASKRLKDNENVVLNAVSSKSGVVDLSDEGDYRNVLAIQYASDRIKDNQKLLTYVVKKDGMLLKYASKRLQNTFEIVLEAVMENGAAIQYASDNLKNNNEIVFAACNSEIDSFYYEGELVLKHLPNQFLSKKKYVTKPIRERVEEFKYLKEDLKNDPKFLLKCIKSNYQVYKFIPESFKTDPVFFNEMILHHPDFNHWWKVTMREHKTINELYKVALKERGNIMELMPEVVKCDREFAEIAINSINKSGVAYRFLCDNLKKNKDLAINAIKVSEQGTLIYDTVPINLKNNNEIIDLALERNNVSFISLPDKLKLDKTFIIKAIEGRGNLKILKHLDSKLLQDLDIVLKAIDKDYRNIRYLPNDIIKRKEVILKCLHSMKESNFTGIDAAEYLSELLPDSLKDDKDLALSIIPLNWQIVHFLSDHLKDDKQIVKEAIKSPYYAKGFDFKDSNNNKFDEFYFASDRIRKQKDIILQELEDESNITINGDEIFEKVAAIESLRDFISELRDSAKYNIGRGKEISNDEQLLANLKLEIRSIDKIVKIIMKAIENSSSLDERKSILISSIKEIGFFLGESLTKNIECNWIKSFIKYPYDIMLKNGEKLNLFQQVENAFSQNSISLLNFYNDLIINNKN